MPGRLINHTLDNLVQGVTQQYQEGRYETQVEEMINCIPSLSRGVLRRNPIIEHKGLYGLQNALDNDPFTYVYNKGIDNEQYLIIVPGNGDWYIYNINNPTATYWSGNDPYLVVYGNITARQAFKTITLGDITFITNSTITVEQDTNNNTLPLEKYLDWSFYWIKLTTQVVTAQRTVDTESGSRIEGFTYYLFDGGTRHEVQAVKDTRPNEADPDVITADRIAEVMAANEVTWTNSGSYVYDLDIKTRWLGEDTNGNTASLAVWKTVTNASELPINLPNSLDGFIVKVVGMADTNLDDYYMQFSSYDNTWIECAEPGISLGVNTETMPHCFYALGLIGAKNFVFDTYKHVNVDTLGDSAWQERTVGDTTTNPDPKFVGNTITNLFFFRNRLGFISNDTITMSRVAEYGGIYLDTLQVFKDDGPINLYVATTDINILRHAVSTASTLIIFSDESQFVLSSGNQPLTAITANLSVLSKYNYSPLVDAQTYGNSIVFTSTAGGYTQLLEMSIKEAITSQGLQADADVLTNHIPSYIPTGVEHMTTHNVLGYTFLNTKQESNAITVLTHKSINAKRVQLAFHKWVFDFDIVGLHIVDNYLYIVTEAGTLATLPLEIPGDIDQYTYLDKSNTGDYKNFISGIWFSNFYFRDSRGLGSNRGRFQIRTMLYDAAGTYMTSITSEQKYITAIQETCFSPKWNDSLPWVDDAMWLDDDPKHIINYFNDKLITVIKDNENVKIVFSNSSQDQSKGFELHTINIEALYYQRSTRI